MQEPHFDLVVHATHEAGFKVGGIGAVLDGLLSTAAYNAAVKRTLLIGPMEVDNQVEMDRLNAPQNQLQIIYSSWHQIDQAPAGLSAGLREIEERFRVRLLYGRRIFTPWRAASGSTGGAHEHEVLLVDGRWADLEQANAFKLELWRHYRIESDHYEWNQEFDLVVRAAKPAFAALNLLIGDQDGSRYMIAHEWLGMPLAFCAQIQVPSAWRLIFYAHEMATARMLVEDHPGHDTRFYNVLQQAQAAGATMGQLFGNRDDFFKHVFIQQATRMHNIVAVGQWVERELRFLGGDFSMANIDLVYNGISFPEIGLEERMASSGRLQQYCKNLLGYRPDYVFSHVTRMVVSKGMWRDIRVLEHLDRLLAEDDRTAVLFMLTTSKPAGRSVDNVLRWEAEYGWPVVHHAENGDLVGHELPLFQGIEAFNSRSRAVKIVFVNQFGWSRERCGVKMPAEMTFSDIRKGTNLEFGQSIYEPFGISQVEPLGFGALCVVTNVCGCVGFVQHAAQEAGLPHFANLLQADYTDLRNGLQVYNPRDALGIGQDVRDRLERANSYNVALAIRATLPVTAKQAGTLLKRGQRVSRRMNWEVVVQDHLLPALRRAG